MDAITKQVLALTKRVSERKPCAVPTNLIRPFVEACRDQHIIVNGGAYAMNAYGRIYGQYFYTC